MFILQYVYNVDKYECLQNVYFPFRNAYSTVAVRAGKQ